MSDEIFFSESNSTVRISNREIDLKNISILIVDDSPTIRKVISSKLSAFGLKILEAADGAEGVEIARKHKPSLILMDLRMPVMDGFQATARLQENPETAGIPVVFLTSVSEVKEKIKAYRLGALDFLNKPIDVITLVARVKSILTSVKIVEEINKLEEDKKDAENWAQKLMAMRSKMAIFDMDLLYSRIDDEMAKAKKGTYALSIFLLDINKLTVLNKHYGFQFGDSVIHHVCDILHESLSSGESYMKSNTDKFFIALPEYSEQKAIKFADETLGKISKLSESIIKLNFGDKVSANIGGLIYEKKTTMPSKNVWEILEKALNESKNNGLNRKVLYYMSSLPQPDGSHQIDRVHE